MNNPLVTILTPAYNRAHTLPDLYASIKAQTIYNFEWLIVDDGSTDDTPALCAQWEDAHASLLRGGESCPQNSEGFSVRLLCRENGGKHRALNTGIAQARGAWVFIVDSDDRLPPDALEKITSLVPEAAANAQCAGIMGLRVNFSGELIGEKLPKNIRYMDAASLTFRYHIRGDKAELFKTDIVRAFPFPEFEGEKFITECVVWYRIAAAGLQLLLSDEVLYLCEYRTDGLSARSLALRIDNPQGTRLFYRETLALAQPFFSLLREAANYVRFSLHQNRCADSFFELPRKGKVLCVFGFLPGLCAYWRDRRARRAP